MSAILHKFTNHVQSQSHRVYPENWEGDGWVAVPPDFEEIAVANSPYIKVTYADDGETITNIEAAERPDPEPEPESGPDVWDELATAIREGVNEV